MREWRYSPLKGETWLERLFRASKQSIPERLEGREGKEGLDWMQKDFKVRSGIASFDRFH